MSLRKATLQILPLLAFLLTKESSAGTVSWSPNPESNVAGYRVHYRTAHELAPKVVDVGLDTKAAIPDLVPETKYFVSVSAYNIHGLESLRSSEISFYSAPRPPRIRLEGPDIVLSVQANPGSTLDLFESDDLRLWKRVETIINPEGAMDLRLLRDPMAPRKFFRLGWSGDSYEGWKSLFGSSGGSSYPDSSFDTYASGADLTGDPGPGYLLVGSAEMPSNSTGELVTYRTFSFRLRESARDTHARIETSSDGTNWVPAAPLLTEVSSELNGDGTRRFVYRELLPAQAIPEGQLQYRLTYSQQALPKEWSFNDWLHLHQISDPDSPYPGIPSSARYAYASGADLLSSPRRAMPRLVNYRVFLEGSWESIQTIEFFVRENLTDFTPQLQVSYDLRTWAPAENTTFPLSNRSNGDGTRTVVHQNISNPGEPTRRFYRVVFRPTG